MEVLYGWLKQIKLFFVFIFIKYKKHVKVQAGDLSR